MAEFVFLAIRLLEDAERACGDLDDYEFREYMIPRAEAVREALQPAMSRLAEYMPKPIGASGAGLQPSSPASCPNCGSHYHLACADDLDPTREGMEAARERLDAALNPKVRAWYYPWEERPAK